MRIVPTALLLGILCLGACDDDNNDLVFVSPFAGTFVLQTINGGALPVAITNQVSPPLVLEIVSGQIAIGSGSSFTETIAFRQTLGGVVTTRTVTCTGSFTTSGTTVTFVETNSSADCGDTFTGVVSGRTLNANLSPGVTAVLVR